MKASSANAKLLLLSCEEKTLSFHIRHQLCFNYAIHEHTLTHSHTSPHRLKCVASTEFTQFFPSASHTQGIILNLFRIHCFVIFRRYAPVHTRTCAHGVFRQLARSLCFFLRNHLRVEFSPRKRNSYQVNSHFYCEFPFVQQPKQEGKKRSTNKP